MKQRLLVMNGQKIIQSEQGGTWASQKVEKAGDLKPGIYNLHMGKPPDKGQKHEGVILHTDDEKVYQQIGKNFVVHDKKDFDIVPTVGSAKSISYDTSGKASVSADAVKLSRGRSL